jgi:predicted Zn-dependent protease
MKARIILVLLLALGIASVVVVQRRHEHAGVSPNAVVNMMADAQRDALRAPLQLTRLSDEEETAIGDEMAEHYLGASADQGKRGDEAARLVQRIGGRLAIHAHRHLNYRFHLIPDRSFLNAFALPGGHVFIGLGLMNLMDTEDELANVLGHELEHIDHYHCVERVQVEAQMRKLQLGAVGDLVQLPLTIFEAGYSKDQEAEADREGLLLAVASGYSPYGAVTMFEKFAKLHREYATRASSPPEELSQLALETLMSYFRSHPLPQERIAQAKAIIREHRLTALTAQTPLLNSLKSG